VTGSEKAFAAGADIKEMQPKGFIDMFSSDFTAIGGDRVAAAASRPSRRSAATRSAAAASSR
jgi:enoyl-CoA hydratase/carnithine racemase